jgi:hypothetical protein
VSSVSFESSAEADSPQITTWTAVDGSKSPSLPPEYWLTGSPGCILACCVKDEEGTVLYLRAEQEGNFVRFHTLFGPVDVVSQKRVALTLLEGFPRFSESMKPHGIGLVMETRSESLAQFMTGKFGFARVEGTDDYCLLFVLP